MATIDPIWIQKIKEVGITFTARKIGVSNAAIWRWISGTAKPYGDNRRRLCDFMVKELPPAEAEEFLASLSAAILDMPSHTAVVRQ
ncbi:MAG TPA: helix-turn-helix transcriptional regulator [Deltaproteobacteria bacterium]|mgnify:FL=1|nr:helix-turn-helix transcriptional regulator [Deltaproteobacteria bacterium]HPA76903.1 helix-turn-helix transcriptional regulator [Deltaproteobacteria bacterium]HPV30728.1 helix-turn-helix transcriptional regulator [Deltaproteobacteria bacterium]HQO61916.1 helix-turn-helix transcriptional regulator [Deltaproteobacteria bacterium]HQQ11241.1 helix-turn-helix transcriptional regulator [Synergistales bacterium]